MKTTAKFSKCRFYRYSLERIWNPELPLCQFIGLNPSTADETIDDPTVRRCIRYAEDWGYGGLIMSNIFAYRATAPRVMKAYHSPLGPENDRWILRDHQRAGITIAAWGTHGKFLNRGKEVVALLSGNLHYLDKTKEGFPRHPLYLKKSLLPLKW